MQFPPLHHVRNMLSWVSPLEYKKISYEPRMVNY